MARPVATKRATAKSDAVKPDAAKPDESKTAAPNRVSNKKKPAYGTNDQTFKWQLGGLIVGVAVAMLASTQQGKEVKFQILYTTSPILWSLVEQCVHGLRIPGIGQ